MTHNSAPNWPINLKFSGLLGPLLGYICAKFQLPSCIQTWAMYVNVRNDVIVTYLSDQWSDHLQLLIQVSLAGRLYVCKISSRSELFEAFCARCHTGIISSTGFFGTFDHITDQRVTVAVWIFNMFAAQLWQVFWYIDRRNRFGGSFWALLW